MATGAAKAEKPVFPSIPRLGASTMQRKASAAHCAAVPVLRVGACISGGSML